jgi:oxygen-independent coproporphyrinogen-3 oxidase
MDSFAARTGLPVSTVEPVLQRAEARGLVCCTRDALGRVQRVQPSERGFDFLSDLQAMFLPPG